MRIKTGDTVIVITGKYKGAQGEVLDVFPKENRVVVSNVNVVKLHQKPKGVQDPGGIIETERPIHASNVMLYHPDLKKGVRTQYELRDGKKVRVHKKSGYVFD